MFNETSSKHYACHVDCLHIIIAIIHMSYFWCSLSCQRTLPARPNVPRCCVLCCTPAPPFPPREADFRKQLSNPRAKKATDALCCTAARLLAETEYRPARRQAAVIVANLSGIPALCRSLLESDPPLTSPKRGIVDSLVTLAMLRSKEDKEEEIGTRRECMRALIGLAESRSTRNMVRIRKAPCVFSSTPKEKKN